MAQRLMLVAFLALVLAGCSGEEVPRPAELDQATAWEDIPDAFGYVSFGVPLLDWECTPEPTSGGWQDIGYPTRWLAWKLGEIIRDLVCVLLTLFQFLANVLAGLVNAIIAALNWFWRLFVFLWLSIRNWFYALWWLVELARATWNMLYGIILWVWIWLQALWGLLLVLVGLVADFVILLLRVLLGLLGLLAWLGGLFIGLFLDIGMAVQGETVPVQLTGTHPIYRYVRGGLEGFRDSSVGWMLWVAWGMAYVGFVWWGGRFLAEKAKPSG